MKLTREKVREAGSCNYCDRGEISNHGKGLVYPYGTVIVLRGKQTSSNFCDECFKEMKTMEVLASEPNNQDRGNTAEPEHNA